MPPKPRQHPDTTPDLAAAKPAIYRVVVQGNLDANWAEWLSGMTIGVETEGENDARTTLTGVVRDQAALRGLLGKLWDLNLTLISVNRTEPESSQTARSDHDSRVHLLPVRSEGDA
jgi:hypothetical protein